MAEYVIDVEKEIIHIIDWIKNYFVKNGPNSKAVIGMSGGKDSTIAAALLCKALGPEKVYGVIMPDGEMRDEALAKEICEYLHIDYRVVHIEDIVSATYRSIGNNCANNERITTNTPARIRMSVLYAIAAEVGGRVTNTCNGSEDYVGFSTKYGDLAGDFSVLRSYYMRWVCEIGDELGLPYKWVYKVPDDGMCGQTDEDKFGFTYKILDSYLIDGIVPDYNTYKKIEEMNKRNLHKNAINLPCPFIRTKREKGTEYKEKEAIWF